MFFPAIFFHFFYIDIFYISLFKFQKPYGSKAINIYLIISYLYFLQLLRQWDKILSHLFSSTWQEPVVTSGHIEWRLQENELSAGQTSWHANTCTFDGWVKLWDPTLCYRLPTDSFMQGQQTTFKGETENMTRIF